MTKELEAKLNPISNAFYTWLQKATIDNWRKTIEEPIDTFVNSDNEAAQELTELYNEYENNQDTLEEIDRYLNQVVESVNNSTLSTWGGAREGAGRKRQGEEARRSTISFVCTESEKEDLKAQAKAAGLSQSQYICQKLFEKK